MSDKQDFKNYLTDKKKKYYYINECAKHYDNLHEKLNGNASATLIDEFARSNWSGYAARDKMIYDFLSTYANFCEERNVELAEAIQEHIKIAFEGLTKKAVEKYKREMVFIPDNTRIDPLFLEGLTNDEFVAAFRAWQDMLCTIYNEIGRGSPFEWGFSSWGSLTISGVSQTRVMDIFKALAECGRVSGDTLIVEKKAFSKAIRQAKLTLNKFGDMGLLIERLDDKNAQEFMVSCPDTPNLITAFYSYFKHQGNCIKDCNKCVKRCWHHIRDFSYRYVEATERTPRETHYLAHIEGTPNKIREIYDFLHDEAAKYGYLFQGTLDQGGLLYKKGSKSWLLAGSDSSYHEVDYLFNPDYEIAVKVQYKRIFDLDSDIKSKLITRFPKFIHRKRSNCWGCRDECAKRVCFEIDGKTKYCCNTFVFSDPTIDDVKFLLELYKEENKIK